MKRGCINRSFLEILFKKPICASGLHLQTTMFSWTYFSLPYLYYTHLATISHLKWFWLSKFFLEFPNFFTTIFALYTFDYHICKVLKFLNEKIGRKRFFRGEEIGNADLMLRWITYWLQVSEEVVLWIL